MGNCTDTIPFAQGISQGISQGSHQKALETAKNLLQFGLSVENIAKATGLSQEDVRELYSCGGFNTPTLASGLLIHPATSNVINSFFIFTS